MKTLTGTVIALIITLIGAASKADAQQITLVNYAPRGSVIYLHGGVGYRYYAGNYYKPYRGGYAIVPPPIGLHVNLLPPGFVTVRFGGIPYFVVGGIYYHEYAPHLYEVVQPPVSVVKTVISSAEVINILPENTVNVQISGKYYYKVNDVYYEKLTTENGSTSYVLVGKTTY